VRFCRKADALPKVASVRSSAEPHANFAAPWNQSQNLLAKDSPSFDRRTLRPPDPGRSAQPDRAVPGLDLIHDPNTASLIRVHHTRRQGHLRGLSELIAAATLA
jgi:hypothetical protein